MYARQLVNVPESHDLQTRMMGHRPHVHHRGMASTLNMLTERVSISVTCLCTNHTCWLSKYVMLRRAKSASAWFSLFCQSFCYGNTIWIWIAGLDPPPLKRISKLKRSTFMKCIFRGPYRVLTFATPLHVVHLLQIRLRKHMCRG